MILAFAGRRVDPDNTPQPRFPLSNVALVRERVQNLLQRYRPALSIGSAACGADLIALTEARALGLRRKIVLPFSRDRFRNTSVVDRPGNWGPAYDQVLDDAEATGDLVTLTEGSDEDAYLAVNRTILDLTLSLINDFHQPGTVVLIWEGGRRGEGDVTEAFGIEARIRSLPVIEVLTI